jgi:magnesium-protoporphyrin O-methyltransferase
MDSLIHYNAADCVSALADLGARSSASIVFTFAPRTPALALMHAVGRLFPRKERAPAIQPVADTVLTGRIQTEPRLRVFSIARTERIVNGFYTSQAMELRAR